MSGMRLLSACFALLSRRDHGRLIAITVAQMATAFLDLIGVLLLGLVSVLSLSVVSNVPPPALVERILSLGKLESVSPEVVAAGLAGLAGLALITKSIVAALLTRRTYRFLAFRQAALSAHLTRTLLSRPLIQIQTRATQDAAFTIIMATQAVMLGILGAASAAAAEVTLLVIMGVGLFAVDPVVTVFAVGFFGVVAVLLQRSLSGWASRMGKESADLDIQAYQAIQEAIASYREISVSDRRNFYVSRIQDLRWRTASIAADSQFLLLLPKFTYEIALVIGALLLAVSQVMTKDLLAAVGVIAIFLVAAARVMPAVMRLQVATLSIRRSEAPARKALQLAADMGDSKIATAPSVSVDASEIRRSIEEGYPDFTPEINARDLEVHYPGSVRPAITQVTFDISPGCSVALVGSTGAGKSTLADLVLGVLPPSMGSIHIGGMAPTLAAKQWPGGIAYVPQEVALINGSVRQNVMLGLPPDAFGDERVWRALDRAQLSAFLREGRDGLDTLVGEGGTRLSGGQRQRLGVARALFTDPRLLVLDEATSALDAETEDSLVETIKDLEGAVTTIIVAHRLATIRHCELILFLEEGRVAARGNFEEVREQSPSFARQANLLGL